MKSALLGSVVVTVAVVALLMALGYPLVRDIDALLDRAQVAADREDMQAYLLELKHNLEARGLTTGHFALIFKTPANDFGLHYRTLMRIIERLDSIRELPKHETAYQVALDDIRGTLRELPNPALDYLWTQYWYLYLLALGVWLRPTVVFVREVTGEVRIDLRS
jgi:hypothetical protein